MNDTGLIAAMRTKNASWIKRWLVNRYGVSYYVDDAFMNVTVHYKMFNGLLYFIDYEKNKNISKESS